MNVISVCANYFCDKAILAKRVAPNRCQCLYFIFVPVHVEIEKITQAANPTENENKTRSVTFSFVFLLVVCFCLIILLVMIPILHTITSLFIPPSSHTYTELPLKITNDWKHFHFLFLHTYIDNRPFEMIVSFFLKSLHQFFHCWLSLLA